MAIYNIKKSLMFIHLDNHDKLCPKGEQKYWFWTIF